MGSSRGRTKIAISKIVVPPKRRALRDVSELALSIQEIGLLQPIVVTTDHRLVAGLHRLEACRSLGWTSIPASVVRLSQLKAELAELDENMERAELTVLERAEGLARRKRLYELLYPETRAVTVRGGPGRGERGTPTGRRFSWRPMNRCRRCRTAPSHSRSRRHNARSYCICRR